MEYSIQFTGEGRIVTTDKKLFLEVIKNSSGIQAIQASNAEMTVSYKSDDPEVTEDIKGDWSKIAAKLLSVFE